MNPFNTLVAQLAARPVTPPPIPTDSAGRTDRLRQLLREGAKTARELADGIGVEDTGRPGALLKQDLKAGRVHFADGCYSWHGTTGSPE